MPKRQGIVISETTPPESERDLDTWLNPTSMEFSEKNPVSGEWELKGTSIPSNPPVDMNKATNMYVDQDGCLVVISDE